MFEDADLFHRYTRAEALEAAKELFPGHRVTVVLKEGEPGT